jgi:integrase/recombinase XerD
MALNLYRRHGSKCPGARRLHQTTYEADELRRAWKRCSCPIYASGTLGRLFKRKNTGQTNWPEAKAIATSWETAGKWAGDTGAPPQPLPWNSGGADSPTTEGITIERAVAAFLAEHGDSSARSTQKKYAIITKKLKVFSAEKGYVMVSQWCPIDVREFRQSWNVSLVTAGKNMSIVKAFFEFALANEWVSRNPARLVKNLRGRAGDDPRMQERSPFSDEELKRIFETCETKYGKQPIRWSRKVHHRPAEPSDTVNYRYKWAGQDLADFISVYTGLRISDVCTFHIDRLRPTGECHIRTTKNGRRVYTWIPEWLQQRIRARAKERGSLIFGEHSTKDMNVVTDVWRRKLKRLWDLCGPWSEKPTPHRFRHTFARILLQRPNVTVRDVAELLGDTEEMVRRRYATWVAERQERLTAVLKEAFAEKPKPNLLVISGERVTGLT